MRNVSLCKYDHWVGPRSPWLGYNGRNNCGCHVISRHIASPLPYPPPPRSNISHYRHNWDFSGETMFRFLFVICSPLKKELDFFFLPTYLTLTYFIILNKTDSHDFYFTRASYTAVYLRWAASLTLGRSAILPLAINLSELCISFLQPGFELLHTLQVQHLAKKKRQSEQHFTLSLNRKGNYHFELVCLCFSPQFTNQNSLNYSQKHQDTDPDPADTFTGALNICPGSQSHGALALRSLSTVDLA